MEPTDQTVNEGQSATFSVAAAGSAPLNYQWNKNGTAVSGATSSSYTTPAATTSDDGAQFTALISNKAGSVTSNPVSLHVRARPSIKAQPASQTVTAGQTATFTVVASGTTPLSYQWRKNGTDITAASSASYTTPPTTTSDSGSQLTVVVSNSAGAVTSNAAMLTVNAAQGTTYSITGTISPAAGGVGATVTLSGAANQSTTANASGVYTFTGLANGSYTVTPTNVGYTFTPTTQNVTVSGANVANVNFTDAAQVTTYSITGTISPAAGGSGATVTLSGAANQSTTANSSGVYTFTGLASGSYTVTPTNTGYTFTPATQNVTVSGANVANVNFTASSQGTFSISGAVAPAVLGTGATVTLSGTASAKVTADNSGNYVFGGLANGIYTVTISYVPTTAVTYTFAPSSQSVRVNGANLSGVNFGVTAYFGTEPSHATYLPRSDAFCAGAITPNSWEPRADNYPANTTTFAPSTFNWSTAENSWTMWTAKRAQITGSYTGTTTEIIQWAACKWGIDEDTVRADAVQESYWHQNTVGDVCGPVGEGSYGLNQVKNQDCSSTPVHGGYPDTHLSTALSVEWFAAHTRSCYDGDFYDGGSWLYNGQTVDQIAAANGWPYVFWACIGFHFSGNWSPGQSYQLSVQTILANRTWASPNF